METKNNKFSKYSDEELRLMLAIAMHDDQLKAKNDFLHLKMSLLNIILMNFLEKRDKKS